MGRGAGGESRRNTFEVDESKKAGRAGEELARWEKHWEQVRSNEADVGR